MYIYIYIHIFIYIVVSLPSLRPPQYPTRRKNQTLLRTVNITQLTRAGRTRVLELSQSSRLIPVCTYCACYSTSNLKI